MARILVVDDQESLRKVIKANLSANGHVIRTASNGEEGLRAIARSRPDLVIMDVKMPGMNGFEALKTIRANEFLKELPVIIMTAFLGGEEEMQAQQLGAAFIAKPFGVDELISKVKESLANEQR